MEKIKTFLFSIKIYSKHGGIVSISYDLMPANNISYAWPVFKHILASIVLSVLYFYYLKDF